MKSCILHVLTLIKPISTYFLLEASSIWNCTSAATKNLIMQQTPKRLCPCSSDCDFSTQISNRKIALLHSSLSGILFPVKCKLWRYNEKPPVHIPENVTRAILLMSLALQSKCLLGSGQCWLSATVCWIASSINVMCTKCSIFFIFNLRQGHWVLKRRTIRVKVQVSAMIMLHSSVEFPYFGFKPV